jgi:hypothetical protein
VRRLGIALLAVGLAGGAISDPSGDAVARPVVMRGRYRVLEADLHGHTTFSDGGLSPFDLVVMAERRHLDVLAVTEHNAVFPAKMARAFSRAVGGPVILVGEEVTTSRYHLVALGLHEAVRARQPPADVIDEIHAQGALAIAAHPVKHFQDALLPVRDRLDGAEVMHPLAYVDRGGDWSWKDMRAFYMDTPSDHPLVAIGSSDYHWASVLGLVRTWVFVDPEARLDEHAVLDALRARATVVPGPGGELFGDPELVQLLRAEPMPPHTEPDDYGYRGRSTFDRVTRALGWLGLLVIVLFRKRAEREREPVSEPAPEEGPAQPV